MRVFRETQAFRQWWLFLILGSMLIISTISFFSKSSGFELNNHGMIAFILSLLIAILFWATKLETRIDASGIHTQFIPFNFFRKNFRWNEISNCFVREYSPISEYGGWGVRGFGTAKAYNVSGNMGIQIVTKDAKKFLIGTNKPEDEKKVIKYYQNKSVDT
ncbi:MAG: hypothetical protein KJP01_04760 [Gramella sp.]|nr:hypothetical protein [Christiangramia sp.]